MIEAQTGRLCMDVAEFWVKVNELCRAYGGSVTSGYRSVMHNAAVGGRANSNHLRGLGADVILDDWSKARKFIEAGDKLGIHVIDEVDGPEHLHLQPR